MDVWEVNLDMFLDLAEKSAPYESTVNSSQIEIRAPYTIKNVPKLKQRRYENEVKTQMYFAWILG